MQAEKNTIQKILQTNNSESYYRSGIKVPTVYANTTFVILHTLSDLVTKVSEITGRFFSVTISLSFSFQPLFPDPGSS